MRRYKSPIFQHRHYAAIAAVLAKIEDRDQMRDIKNAFADLFQGDNPYFQRERFISAASGIITNGRDKR